MTARHGVSEHDDRREAGRHGAALSRAEFAAHYAEAWPALRSIAAAVLGTPAGADDVVQEAAIAALNKLRDFSPGTSFTAWMGQFVRYTALNAARRTRRAPTNAVDPHTLAHWTAGSRPETTPSFDADGRIHDHAQQTFDDRVLNALHSVERPARICLLLRTLHDMPYREISRILDIPEGTAMSHVHRARKAMRDILSEPSHDTTHAEKSP